MLANTGRTAVGINWDYNLDVLSLGVLHCGIVWCVVNFIARSRNVHYYCCVGKCLGTGEHSETPSNRPQKASMSYSNLEYREYKTNSVLRILSMLGKLESWHARHPIKFDNES